MAVLTYEQLALRWCPDSQRDHIFIAFAVVILASLLATGFFLSSIPVPKQDRDTHIDVPERIARFITEKQKPPKKEPSEAPPRPIPRPKPKFQRSKPEERKPLTKLEEQARQNAEESGLLALTRELADLVDTASISDIAGVKMNMSADNHTFAAADTTILTAEQGGRNGDGVRPQAHVSHVGQTQLNDNQKQLAQQLLASKGEIVVTADKKADERSRSTVRGENVRSEADVAYVMDQHKNILHSIYRQARRTNPGLRGKVILEITILPSGQVSEVRVNSSELSDETFEARLVARIKHFNFGAHTVETLTVIVPVEFLPS